MKKILFLILIVLCVVFKTEAGRINPPINVTFRQSFLMDGSSVMVVHNLSASKIYCTLYTDYDDGKRVAFAINPYKSQEIGVLQFAGIGHFKNNEGWIKVDGYWKKLRYKIRNGQYWTKKAFF